MAERPLFKFAVRFAAAMCVGALVGYLGARTGYLDSLFDLGWLPSDVMALLLALLLLGTAAFCAVAGSDPRIYRRVANVGAAEEPVDPEEISNARRQAIVLLAAGLALAVPPVAVAAGAPIAVRQIAAGAILLLMAVETFYNWKLWRHGDELTRRVIVESGAIAFWVSQMALFLFAALARMELVPDMSSWTMLQIVLAIYLAASSVVGVRRGLANT